jgi:hypothetical protein
LQFNCNGLTGKIDELLDLMTRQNIVVAAIQETKLSALSKLNLGSEYTILRQDRLSDSGGGVAFIIHRKVQFAKVPYAAKQQHEEVLSIDVQFANTTMRLVNVYIPPRTSCDNGFRASISHLLRYNGDCLIMGDFNAHDAMWYSSIEDERGETFASEIDSSNYGVLNENTPTRLPKFGQPTSPDISLVNSALLTSLNWETSTTLASDHLPITINIPHIETTRSKKKTYVNIVKADWVSFKATSEELFSLQDPPTSVIDGQKTFRRIVNKAANRHIPMGRIPFIKPGLPNKAVKLLAKRDELRRRDPKSHRLDPRQTRTMAC